MPKKLFISYSHKDESFKDELNEHLVMMHRNGIVESWHDRKIVAAEDWKDKIDENLEAADIIIFLVSSSFLASPYCYDVEVKRAVERHTEGEAQIISIIIRDCDWQECDFSKFQVVPKDALPVAKWSDRDSAWLDVVKGIKTHIREFKAKEAIISPKIRDDAVSVSESFRGWLEDTEIVLTHRRVNRINLSDIYVVPDMEFERDSKTDLLKIKSASEILKAPGHHIIAGDEQLGKTSLLKYFYSEFAKSGYMPIFLDGPNIKKSDINISLRRSIQEQYVNLSLDVFLNNPNKVILLDNVDEIDLNGKFRKVFLEELIANFGFTILTCHESYSYVAGEIPALDAHDRYELLGLGNKKREEISQKWICMGIEESISDSELYSKCDDLKEKLNAVIKKNIVPPRPIYILMLLQWFEANAQLNLELTSYGHCYQQLIYKSFEKAKVSRQDFDKYLNILTEISWSIYMIQDNLNEFQVEKFFDQYSQIYLGVDREIVREKLIANSILAIKDGKLGFKYPYIYYFFVGKKIADSYSDSEEVRDTFPLMLERLHREDVANILIFITHHTKESWVLKEIKSVLNSLFLDYSPATLKKEQLLFMDEFMKKIPDLVIEQREIQQERDEHNEKLDEIQRSEREDGEPTDVLANINKTFKAMEISGQIIRNRHASLTRASLTELADNGASSGLRFLEYFLKISDSSKNEIIKFINSQIEEHPNTSNQEIERSAEHTYMHLTYGVINGVVRKIASSIGSKEALEIYNDLADRKETPAFLLIKQAIELQFHKTIHIGALRECVEKLKNNPVCLRILKEMVIQHIYMFPTDFKEKQMLSSLLGISVKNQRQMDRNKRGKG